jgi:hypothetical protein
VVWLSCVGFLGQEIDTQAGGRDDRRPHPCHALTIPCPPPRHHPQVFQRRMDLLAQLERSESPTELLLAAHQLLLIQSKGAVLLPSAPEADAALATGIPHLVALLSRTATAAAARSEGEEEEGGEQGVGRAVRSLEEAVRMYEGEGEVEERAQLARALSAAQAAVKEAFAKKGGGAGSGGGEGS